MNQNPDLEKGTTITSQTADADCDSGNSQTGSGNSDNDSRSSRSTAELRRQSYDYENPPEDMDPDIDKPGQWLIWFHRSDLIYEVKKPKEGFLSKL
jgi:hypothetical protein